MCQFKLVLLGESAVGKSSLVLRFVKGQFHEYQESTIGGMYLDEVDCDLLWSYELNPVALLLLLSFWHPYRGTF